MIKYTIKRTNSFKRQYKKVRRQGKDISKMEYIIEKLASGQKLDAKYKDHNLSDNKYYKGCRECHIEPDWLLVYKIIDNELILYLVETGSHSDLFNIWEIFKVVN